MLTPDTHLPYCGNGTYSANGGLELKQRPCQYLNQYAAVYPRQQTSATTLSTRITHEVNSFPKSEECEVFLSPNCQPQLSGEYTFYVASPELFTLYIDHSFTVPEFDMSRSAKELDGMLKVRKSQVDDPSRILGICFVYGCNQGRQDLDAQVKRTFALIPGWCSYRIPTATLTIRARHIGTEISNAQSLFESVSQENLISCLYRHCSKQLV